MAFPYKFWLVSCYAAAILSTSLTHATAVLDYELLASAEHNPGSFTQGWIKDGNTFYESSGLYGKSFIQRYNERTSTTVRLPRRYFAEGLTLFNGSLYLITWKEETAFVIDKDSLETIKTFSYSGEGWGLTHNNQHLIMSNGSSSLTFREPSTWDIAKSLTIKGLTAINELEYVDGIIWANSLNDNHIYAIEANQGCLLAKLDLSDLRRKTVRPNSGNVLNGIAYDAAANGLWITGKRWPKKYLIRLPAIASRHC